MCEECEKTIREENLKHDLDKRLNKIIGQVNGIKKMIESDRYCADVIIQLSAVEKSVRSVSNIILENHMKHCVSSAIKNGDNSKIDEVMDLIKRFN